MNSDELMESNCTAWIALFTGLNQGDTPSIEHLEKITSPDVRFRDPFNDLQGRSEILKLLVHTRQQIKEVNFRLCDKAVSGSRVYLKWKMTGRVRYLGLWQVQGMSELVFNTDEKLYEHIDYWDASEQFYSRLPVIGWFLRRIRLLASVS